MSSRVNVLQVLGRSAGGIGRHVARVVEALEGRRGLEFDIAAPPDLRIAMPKPVIPVPIPDGPVRGHVGAIGMLRSLVDRKRYAVVHAHGLRAAVDAGLAARGLGAPVVYTAHNVIHPAVAGPLRARLYGPAERLALRVADHTLAPSEEIARHLRAEAPGIPSLQILPLGVPPAEAGAGDPAEVRRELAVNPDQRLVVSVARLSPQKDLGLLLEALSLLDDDVVLAVIGEGPLDGALKAEAARLRVAGRVRFLGFRDDVGRYLRAADVFCLSSRWEAVALAAKEAILEGVPVVSTDAGGMRELVEDGVTGRLVPVGDAPALAGALRDVLASPEDRRRYADAARKVLEERFSETAMLLHLEQLYLDLAGAR